MRFDEKFHFRIETETQTEMGGWIKKETDGTAFDAHSTPIKADILLRDYGIVSTQARRIITKDNIDFHESLIIRDKKYRYKILQVLDYKMTIFLVEKIGEYHEN